MCLISERAEIRRNISMMKQIEKYKLEQKKKSKKKEMKKRI
jgi:hypothetical protein